MCATDIHLRVSIRVLVVSTRRGDNRVWVLVFLCFHAKVEIPVLVLNPGNKCKKNHLNHVLIVLN